MIEKLSEYKITSRDGAFINVECNTKIINTLVQKINELVDAVNELQTRAENVQKIDIGELAFLQKENSDLKDEVEKLQKQLAEWQNANISLIKDSAICNTYTHIRWDEFCRLKEIADKYAEITGHKGLQNE